MIIPWILVLIAIGIVMIALLGIVVLKRKGWRREVDYRNYFNMGMIWLPAGIFFYLIFKSVVGLWFLFMGLVYLAIGLKNKEKWGKPQKVSPTYQKIMMIAVIIGVIFLALGIIVYEIMI
jgi:hypothetical protein